MNFNEPLVHGIIHKRYKRFLSDIELENGEIITAHTPNTGSMKNCWAPGWKVLLSLSDNPKRKLPYTLELTNNGKTWINVNTSKTNKIVHEALEQNIITELIGYNALKAEAKIGDSRLDFLLTFPMEEKCYVEVKNVTLTEGDGLASFPDAKTTRGTKHLKELMDLAEKGCRAVMLFVISREDVNHFSPNARVDPIYAETLKDASERGVEILCYQCKVSPDEIKLSHPIPFKL